MAKKNEETRTGRKSETHGASGPSNGSDRKDVFSLWTDGYSAVSKLWQESYVDLYSPWIESAGKLFDKAAELSKETSVDKYQEFIGELVKMQQNNLGKLYAMPKPVTDKDTIERFVAGAKDSAAKMRSWSDELEANSKRAQDLLLSGAGPENYREFYEMWTKSYEKIFDDFLEMMTSQNTKEVLEGSMGIPSMYLMTMAESARMWKESYKNLYTPWVNSSIKLYEKLAELSKGNPTPEKYRAFYDQWTNSYRETFAKMFSAELARPSKDMVDSMLKSVNTSMDMYRSWLTALEKMAERMRDVLTDTRDPEAYKEFYELWVKTYEKAFEDFFEYMPVMEPMRRVMEPLRKAARVQADIYSNVTKMWMEGLSGQKRAE